MNFNNNLIQLRKKYKLSQEALAEKIGVTRQTIYKWETSATYPEMDKLLDLAKVFDISVDYLINGDMEEPEEETVSKEEIIKKTKTFSYGIGISIAFILLGVAIIVAFADNTPLLGLPLGISIIFLAVLSIVGFSMKMESFRKLNDLRVTFTKKEKAEMHTTFIIKLIIGLALIFIGVGQLIFLGIATDETTLFGNNTDIEFIMCLSVGALLILVGIAVFLFTQAGIMDNLYDKPEEIIGKEKKTTKRNELVGKICGAIMMTATIVFLLCGFLGDLWKICWVAFAVGGIACGIVSVIIGQDDDIEEPKNEEDNN